MRVFFNTILIVVLITSTVGSNFNETKRGDKRAGNGGGGGGGSMIIHFKLFA